MVGYFSKSTLGNELMLLRRSGVQAAVFNDEFEALLVYCISGLDMSLWLLGKGWFSSTADMFLLML